MVSKGVEVKKLPCGDFIVVRKDATIFKGDNND
jgi:hypothetical protein